MKAKKDLEHWIKPDGRCPFDGLLVLEHCLKNEYVSIAHVIAEFTAFTHPDTVKGVFECRNVFQTIRAKDNKGNKSDKSRETYSDCNTWMYDDNSSPRDAFLYANGLKRKLHEDVQFNHLYQLSDSIDDYTNLANIVMTPAFIAKLTDTHSETKELLQYRAYELYGYDPEGKIHAKKPPKDYDNLPWAEPLKKYENVEAFMRKKIFTKKGNRLSRCIEKYGWFFEPKASNSL
ncbi:MAG: hypothetical protein ACKO37_05090 [Vampirovibrionales bacterium]